MNGDTRYLILNINKVENAKQNVLSMIYSRHLGKITNHTNVINFVSATQHMAFNLPCVPIQCIQTVSSGGFCVHSAGHTHGNKEQCSPELRIYPVSRKPNPWRHEITWTSPRTPYSPHVVALCYEHPWFPYIVAPPLLKIYRVVHPMLTPIEECKYRKVCVCLQFFASLG